MTERKQLIQNGIHVDHQQVQTSLPYNTFHDQNDDNIARACNTAEQKLDQYCESETGKSKYCRLTNNKANWAKKTIDEVALLGSLSTSCVIHRSFDRRSSSFMVGLNLQSMILGTTTLCVPYAFGQAGIYAIPLICTIGVMTSYTAELLADCLYVPLKRMRHKRLREYASFLELCVASFPFWGNPIMKIIIFSTMARNVAMFILLTNLTHNLIKELDVKQTRSIDDRWWNLMWLSLILPLLFLKRVSAIAWVSLMGLIPYLIALFATLFYCASLYRTWSLDNIRLTFDMEGFALAFGILMNSNAIHLSFPILEGSMRTPKHYKCIVRSSFVINTTIKFLFGAFGLLSFGSKIKESVTANLEHLTSLAIIVRLGVMCFSYLTIPMQSYVVFDHVDEIFYKRVKLHRIGQICWLLASRCLLMSICMVIAIFFPRFGIILSIIGSFRGVLVTLVLPCLFHLRLHGETPLHTKIINVAIVIVGTIGSILGLVYSMKALLSDIDS